MSKSWGDVTPRDKIWYERPPFSNSNFFILNGSASAFGIVFLEENQLQLRDDLSPRPQTSRRERPFVASSVAPSVALSDSSLLPELEIAKQPEKLLGPKPPANTSIPKYSEDDLQKILNIVLEARAPIPAPDLVPALVPAPVVSKVLREKLKAHSLDVYRGKFHMDCYNFCQQCKNYFATAGATGPTRILFAVSFFRDRISFRWQQYKRRYDTETSVSVTWHEFKAFLCWSLGDSQAFVNTYWGKIKKDSQYQLEEILD